MHTVCHERGRVTAKLNKLQMTLGGALAFTSVTPASKPQVQFRQGCQFLNFEL